MAWLTRAKTAMTKNQFPDPQEIETYDITQGKQLLQKIFPELKGNITDLHRTPVKAGQTADDKNNAYNTLSLAASAKKFAAGDDVWVLTRLLPMVDRCAG